MCRVDVTLLASIDLRNGFIEMNVKKYKVNRHAPYQFFLGGQYEWN